MTEHLIIGPGMTAGEIRDMYTEAVGKTISTGKEVVLNFNPGVYPADFEGIMPPGLLRRLRPGRDLCVVTSTAGGSIVSRVLPDGKVSITFVKLFLTRNPPFRKRRNQGYARK